MRNPGRRPQHVIVLASIVLAGILVAKRESFPVVFADQPVIPAGQSLPASGVLALHGILDSAHIADLRWPSMRMPVGVKQILILYFSFCCCLPEIHLSS
jgi:hypothetical protein